MTGTAVRNMRSKHTIAVIAHSLLDTPDTWSGSRQARQWVFNGHVTITAVQCTHVTCLEHWTDTMAAGRVNTSDTALQQTQTSLHYSLTVSTGWTDETKHHHNNKKCRVHTRDACRLHASLHEGCSTRVRSLHTLVCRLHSGVMQHPALRRYAGCSMLQHTAWRSYAGCCSLHAGCCNMHTTVCRLQTESLRCMRSHFEKCTWLVKCCRFKAARPPLCGVRHGL